MRSVSKRNVTLRSVGFAVLSISLTVGLASGQDRPQRGDGQDRGNRQDQPQRGDRADRGDRGDRGNRQQGSRGMGNMGRMSNLTQVVGEEIFRPTYMVRDLNIYAVELDLSREQQSMVKTLIEDYDAAFQVNVDEIQAELRDSRPDLENDPEIIEQREVMRERFQEVRADIEEELERMRESGEIADDDRGAMRDLWRSRMTEMRDEMQDSMSDFLQTDRFKTMYAEGSRIISTWLALRAQLETEFQANLSVLLSDQQNSMLPTANRAVRRANAAGRGRFAGEGTNLINVLREVGVDYGQGDDELATSINTYMVDLDEAIQARNQYLISQVPSLLNALERSAPRSIERLVSEQSDLHQGVRNVHDQYILVIAERLPQDQATAFSQEALRAGYPQIYSPIGAQRAFVAANKIDDLDANTREAVAALTEQFEMDIAMDNESLRQLTRTTEPEQFQDRTARRLVFLAGESMERDDDSDGDRLNETYRQRFDNGQRYLEQLAILLTDEQYASLPGTDDRFSRRGRGNRSWGGSSANREEFMKQYDKDGDGEINDEEREALREDMRQRFGGQDGRGGGRRGGEGGRGGGRGGERGGERGGDRGIEI